MSNDNTEKLARYSGFISYSQKDKAWAKRIHKALENYRLPIGLPGELTKDKKSKRLGRFFRDDDELSGAPSLSEALENALDASNALIVICSPNAAKSKWVDAEIRRFKSGDKAAKVFAIIVDGQPDPVDPEDQCFPPSLLFKVAPDGSLTDESDEPLAPNAAKDSFPKLITRVVSGLISVDFDTLWQREKRRTKRRRIFISLAAMVLIGVSGFGLMTLKSSERKGQVLASAAAAQEAQTAMDEGRFDDALGLVVEALPNDLQHPDKPVVPAALAALNRLMADNNSLGILANFDNAILSLHFIGEGRMAVSLLNSNQIKIIDADSGKLLNEIEGGRLTYWLEDGQIATIKNQPVYDADDVHVNDIHQVRLIDVVSGETIYSADTPFVEGENHHTAFSPQGTYVLTKKFSKQPASNKLVVEAVAQATKPEKFIGKAPFMNGHPIRQITFTSEDTLVFSWGSYEHQGLGIWHFKDGAPKMLVDTNAAMMCTGVPAPKKTPDDGFALLADKDEHSLSPDRKILTLAQTTGNEGRCLTAWRTDTDARLPSIHIDEVLHGAPVFLSDDLYVVNSGVNVLNNREGGAAPIANCTQKIDNSFGLIAQSDKWIFDMKAPLSICAHNNEITVLRGAELSGHNILKGHSAQVRALAYDPKTGRLWSGGEKGSVRLWQLPSAASIDASSMGVATDGGHTASLEWTEKSKRGNIHVYAAQGKLISPAIPLPDTENAWQFIHLFGAETVMVSDRNQCANPRDCAKGRLTMFNVEDGARLRVFDDLKPSTLYTPPGFARLVMSSDKKTAATIGNDGTVLIFGVRTGETVNTYTAPDGDEIYDIVYAAGTWWSLSKSGSEQYKISLSRLTKNGANEIAVTEKAKDAIFVASPDGENLLIKFFMFSDRVPVKMYSAQKSKGITAVDLSENPHKGLKGAQSFAVFPPRLGVESQKSMVFSAGDVLELGPPIVIDMADGKTKYPISPRIEYVGHWDFIDDPIGRAFIGIADNQLRIVSMDEQRSLCPNLDETPAHTGALSPDGKTLAIATGSVVTVFDLDLCAVTRSTSYGLHVKSLNIVDDQHIWIEGWDLSLRILSMDQDSDELLRRAQKLAAMDEEK